MSRNEEKKKKRVKLVWGSKSACYFKCKVHFLCRQDFLLGWQSSRPGREAMPFLHHPYAVNHLAILENREKSLSLEWPVSFYCILSPLLFLCVWPSVCWPGHQTPAPSRGGWHWPAACGCSRSPCCGTRSILWGLGWTCQSSLCSPVEGSTLIKPNVLVQGHVPVCCTVWHLQLRLCLCASLVTLRCTNDKPICGWVMRHSQALFPTTSENT